MDVPLISDVFYIDSFNCPDGWYLYLHHRCEPRDFDGSYSTGDAPDKNSNKTTSSKSRSDLKGDTLKKWESTLNLRVHAHGYDVELIMKAPCKDNYPLGITSSCPDDWVPCDHGSDHGIPI